MSYYTTISASVPNLEGDEQSGSLVAEVKKQVELGNGDIHPAGNRYVANVSSGTATITVPATAEAGASPSGVKVFFYFLPSGKKMSERRFLGAAVVAYSASTVTLASII